MLLTNHMASFMADNPSAASSSSAPAATLGKDDSPTELQFEIWSGKDEFQDAQSMTDSVMSVDKTWVQLTGDEA